MLSITRRNFIKIGAGALAVNMANLLPIYADLGSGTQNTSKAKFYTIFFRTAPSTDDTHLLPMSNDELLRQLKRDCSGVDFTVRDLSKSGKLENVLNEIEDLQRLNYDGVIVYGWPRDYKVLKSGLPTINICIVNDFLNNPIKIYQENKVVLAFLDPWKFSTSFKNIDRMYNDLVEKIKLIKALKKLRDSTILTVTDNPFVNVTYGDALKQSPQKYNELILDAIMNTFGVKVIKIGSDEVCNDTEIEELWYNKSKKANEIANMWIKNAEKMINTIDSEVVRSAKCYLAMKLLMHKYGANSMAFHIRALNKNPKPEDYVTPALATSEFQKKGIVAKCQSHLNIVLSEMVLQYSLGVPSMLGDYSVDTYNNTSIVQHCEGPWNPWGGDKTVPYIITDHRERQVRARSKPGVSAASWILYPPDEPVTIWQLDVLKREILFHLGKTTPIYNKDSIYKDHLWEMM
jgi:hypothetical protein